MPIGTYAAHDTRRHLRGLAPGRRSSAEIGGKKGAGELCFPVEQRRPDAQLNVIKLIGPRDNRANYRYQSTIELAAAVSATPTGLFYSDDKPH